LYRDSASNAVDRKCYSFLCAADFHRSSSPVSGLRQRLAVRVYIIGR
jgi:anthranilate phosphoribosyltransferase